jgi:hypothetical protein
MENGGVQVKAGPKAGDLWILLSNLKFHIVTQVIKSCEKKI